MRAGGKKVVVYHFLAPKFMYGAVAADYGDGEDQEVRQARS